MRVKTYRGEDTQEVLARIKTELGADAVILSRQTRRDNGRTLCEVTAALDDDNTNSDKESTLTAAAGNGSGNGGPARAGGLSERGLLPDNPPGQAMWHREWSRIKEHFTALMRPQLDFASLKPTQRLALEYLEREDVAQDVILDLFKGLAGNPETSVLRPLEQILTVRPWAPDQWTGKHHILAGPHGAGKTTTLLRMALAHRRAEPGSRILLVNANLRRADGRMALRHMAEFSAMGFFEAAEQSQFTQLKRKAKDYDKVFIDLPGCERGEHLDRLLDVLDPSPLGRTDLHLVFSPHYSQGQMQSFFRQYFTDSASSLIWTKLDEADSYGALINAASITGLPVSAICSGPGLTDTLFPADHLSIWRLIFKHRMPDSGEMAA